MHILLKTLLSETNRPEVCDEAIIVPEKQILLDIEKKITKFIADFDPYIRKLESRYPDKDERELYFHWSDEWLTLLEKLNTELLPYKVSFKNFESRGEDAYFKPHTDEIVVQLTPLAYAQIEKNQSKRNDTIKQTVATVGHELIHREQYKRGKGKIAYNMRGSKKSASPSYSKYRNIQVEVMAWAFSLIRDKIDNGEIKDTQTAISFIRDLAADKKLDVYDQANRKKVMRLMVDYANKLLSKNDQP